jgi:hypothetical protein
MVVVVKKFDPLPKPKSFQQLLAEGVPNKGGLAQLASAEQQALSRYTAAGGNPSPSITSAQKH